MDKSTEVIRRSIKMLAHNKRRWLPVRVGFYSNYLIVESRNGFYYLFDRLGTQPTLLRSSERFADLKLPAGYNWVLNSHPWQKLENIWR